MDVATRGERHEKTHAWSQRRGSHGRGVVPHVEHRTGQSHMQHEGVLERPSY
ncbi:hypothetical protein HanRHA438_Chr06g0249121 [Helianthus annuus]|nr:hypothetical protein HanRHA438_Chr06g0249121 [Helianthus annuus]